MFGLVICEWWWWHMDLPGLGAGLPEKGSKKKKKNNNVAMTSVDDASSGNDALLQKALGGMSLNDIDPNSLAAVLNQGNIPGGKAGLVAAMQDKLMKMVGQPTNFVEHLPG